MPRGAGFSLKAVRRHCLDCAGNMKCVTWCPCDGAHSTRCEMWPFRFGMSPDRVRKKYGPGLITPRMMPAANANLDTLPASMEAATAYLGNQNGS
jgi:hypothetical protein